MIRFLLSIIIIFLIFGAVGSYYDLFRADGHRDLLESKTGTRSELKVFTMHQIDSLSARGNYYFTIKNAVVKVR